MNFTLMPSLEHITLVKVATLLWNEYDIRSTVIEFSNSPLFLHVDDELCLIPPAPRKKRNKWQTIENKVMQKVPPLNIPLSLKDKLLPCIQAIGLRILKFLEYHCSSCGFDLDLPEDLCWTPQGIIDKKRTAEVLIKDESIDITTRYKLACIYCLEDDIPELWSKISESDRKSFYNERDPNKVLQQELVVFWTYFIKGEMYKIEDMIRRKLNRNVSPYRYALQSAAVSGNKVATEYFVQKLPDTSLTGVASKVIKIRRDCYRSFTDPPKEYHSEVLCYLLSQMTWEQQIEIYKIYHFEMLKCLLDWPWQIFFVDTARHLWEYFPENYYDVVLRIIIFKVIAGDKDYNYQELFAEFWNVTPYPFKSYVINDSRIAGLVGNLLWIKDRENIKLIFKDATPEEKRNLIFSEAGGYICEDMIYFDEWDLIKYFIPLCLTSIDDMTKFKEKFDEHITLYCPKDMLESNKEKFERFFRLVDELISKCDERNVNESNSNSNGTSMST